jgi:hypothetical protein
MMKTGRVQVGVAMVKVGVAKEVVSVMMAMVVVVMARVTGNTWIPDREAPGWRTFRPGYQGVGNLQVLKSNQASARPHSAQMDSTAGRNLEGRYRTSMAAAVNGRRAAAAVELVAMARAVVAREKEAAGTEMVARETTQVATETVAMETAAAAREMVVPGMEMVEAEREAAEMELAEASVPLPWPSALLDSAPCQTCHSAQMSPPRRWHTLCCHRYT